ncbi:unnamed protein product [Cyclocybe aegerita]|uniref:F-box domain-containing protein n=1 Tax=Cyclocybe aegerita TaxID=1973307 RepID=A0A8S0W9K1_CYCAE|nr:unnamed protein product [Cyclocybe aegerita]
MYWRSSVSMTSAIASSLTSLPDDLLFVLMANLDGPSIRSMALTCRALYQIFQSAAIQYAYELDLNCMEDAGSGRPPAELLKALRDRRTAWGELNWKSVKTVKAGPVLAAYELVAGVFAQTDGFNFSVFQLPSTTCKGTCITTPIDFRIRDFIIDVAQDLVIFLHEEVLPSGSRRGNLYCRTISTNQPHPACSAASTLSFEVPQHPQYGNIIFVVELELAVDVLFLSMRQGHALRLLIWNWTMGVLIYDSLDQLSPFINDLDIVQRDVFILTSYADSGKILIYQFSPTVACTPVLIATLSLPEMNGPRMLWFRVHSGQYQERPTPGALFMPSPTARTHVLSAAYSSTQVGGWYTLFVQSSTFLRYVDRGDEGQEVSWKEWGEEDSRFMARRIGGNWLRYVHGNRVVCNSLDKIGIDVLNFSSFTCNTDSSASGSRERQCFSRGNPTVISKDVKIFEDDVITRLPYQIASHEMEKTPFAYMIDEERIIGLQFGSDTVELTIYSF